MIKERIRDRFCNSLQSSASNGQIVNCLSSRNSSVSSCCSEQVPAHDSSILPYLHDTTSLKTHVTPESRGQLKCSGLLAPSESFGNERSLKKKDGGSPKDDTVCLRTEDLMLADDILRKDSDLGLTDESEGD